RRVTPTSNCQTRGEVTLTSKLAFLSWARKPTKPKRSDPEKSTRLTPNASPRLDLLRMLPNRSRRPLPSPKPVLQNQTYHLPVQALLSKIALSAAHQPPVLSLLTLLNLSLRLQVALPLMTISLTPLTLP